MSPISGVFMSRLGKKNFVVFGMLLMTIATGTFGLSDYVGKSAGWFFAVSIFARLTQGFADGMLTVTTSAIIVMEYPTKQE
jgi:MFS family permease